MGSAVTHPSNASGSSALGEGGSVMVVAAGFCVLSTEGWAGAAWPAADNMPAAASARRPDATATDRVPVERFNRTLRKFPASGALHRMLSGYTPASSSGRRIPPEAKAAIILRAFRYG